MPLAERRSCPRHPASRLAARLRCNHRLRLLDLGDGGARVETTEWLAPGRRYVVRLPSLDLSLAGTVLRCAVVRVDDDALGGCVVYEAGVSFDGLGEVEHERLSATLSGLAAEALPRPRGETDWRPTCPVETAT